MEDNKQQFEALGLKVPTIGRITYTPATIRTTMTSIRFCAPDEDDAKSDFTSNIQRMSHKHRTIVRADWFDKHFEHKCSTWRVSGINATAIKYSIMATSTTNDKRQRRFQPAYLSKKFVQT
jgi:hypothetical protein